MAGKITSGKQANQKFKPLLVWYLLSTQTDENHFLTAEQIVENLDKFGISAERRSIYSDIKQLNKILCLMDESELANPDDIKNLGLDEDLLEELSFIDDVEDELEENPELAFIKLKPKKGFYLTHPYTLQDIRLIIESIYASKFIDSSQMTNLVDIISGLISKPEAEKLRHSVLNIDYSRTSNEATFFNVERINDAMSQKIEGVPHTPEKISFKYMRYSISDLKQTAVRRGGENVVVSPYKLIISDGNYYLRCFDDRNQRMQTYRVDRMKDVKLTGLPRDGEEAAAAEDYKSYTQRVFSMFGGEKEHIRLKFSMSLLDTVIEKFGKDKLKYNKIDDHHFSVLTEVEISPQFFSWLCGLGTSVEILDPPKVKEDYINYLNNIVAKYK